jgi:hypothetical protein
VSLSRRLRSAAALALALLAPAAARATVYATQAEALAEAFPDAERIERRSFALSPEQAAQVERGAGAPLESRLVTLHTAFCGGAPQGHAFIDVHVVRTLPEALLVVLLPDGTVRSVRVLAFYEPSEYQPPSRWLAQFEGRRADEPGGPGRVHAVAGATLSSRAATRSVRRALALFRILIAPQAEAPPTPTEE